MKHYILEDSSFIIALMDKSDSFHGRAWQIFDNFLKAKQYIRVIVPSMAFFETIGILTRKGLDGKGIENKLWNLLHIDEVFNIPLIETMSFKLCRKYCHILKDDSFRDSQKTPLYIKIADFLIAAVGIDYDAQILTFDKKMWQRIKKFYPNIYHCTDISEARRFFGDMKDSINKINHIRLKTR